MNRTDRLEHNHVFQEERGLKSCPACATINVEHMTTEYFFQARYALAQTPKTIGNKWTF